MTPRSDYPQNRKPHESRILHTVGADTDVEEVILEFCRNNPHANRLDAYGKVQTYGTLHFFKRMVAKEDYMQICGGMYDCIVHHGEALKPEVHDYVMHTIKTYGAKGHLTAAQTEHIKEYLRIHLDEILETYTYRSDNPR